MAVRTTVTLKDDLDGSTAEETVHFGLGTAEYEIDLSAANASRFRAQVAPFIEHARIAGRGQRTRAGRSSADRRASAEVRAWARQHGVELSERGRIPASVTEQYEKATSTR
jgi:hypothetical protein